MVSWAYIYTYISNNLPLALEPVGHISHSQLPLVLVKLFCAKCLGK